jgi:outer membrane protein OmpA-like peptidoglycan-associated protein
MKKSIIICLMLTAAVLIIACSKQVKEEPQVAAVDTSMVSGSNDQLSKYPIAGFGYKSAEISKKEWEQWAKNAAPVVKEILGKIPDGYALEIRGHTDGSGPEEPLGAKPGNLKISEQRAQTVLNALKKAGIESDKIVVKGAGASELIPGVDPRDPKQRRVTFAVVKK